MGLDMHQRKAVTEKQASRYRAGSKKEKSRILDEFIALTGYNRKYAIHLLSNCGKYTLTRIDGRLVQLKATHTRSGGSERRGRKRYYDEQVEAAVITLWQVFGPMCGKRLEQMIRTFLSIPGCLDEFSFSKEVRKKLGCISAASIDRLLIEERKKDTVRGTCHTRAASAKILARIPVRTFSEQPGEPGHFQADLVGHDGGDARGDFCYTLNATDPATGWIEPRALQNKAGKWSTDALRWINEHSPIPVSGWHTDSGTEFINAHMERFCREQCIEFTRSRFYKKNDNCYVEQKNNSVIRATVGYLRYEGPQACRILNEIYDSLRLLVNFFHPSAKLTQKTRNGSKVSKRYDTPKTPYQRVLDSDAVSPEVKQTLRRQLAELNPLELQREIARGSEKLLRMVEGDSEPHSSEGAG